MKKFVVLLTALMFNAIAGATIGYCVDAPLLGAISGIGISLLSGNFLPQGSLYAGVLTEVWTGEIVRTLKEKAEGLFFNGVRDYSQYAENDVIHLVDCGAEPDVLVNNKTYPINTQELKDGDIAISLDKFQTKATPITDDDLYACSYDRIQSVKDRHADKIAESKYSKAIHAFAPDKNTADTPVIETTGELDGTRKRLTKNDIIALKKALDNMKVPVVGRRLVLCPDHVNDLLLTDQKFSEQYYNYTTGRIANMYGFEVFEYADCPVYAAAGTKKAYGAKAEATDRSASVYFHLSNSMKAAGTTKMYYSEAKNDPQNQRNLINFRHYFIALPLRTKGCGAILSGKNA